jgi:hypothetical protein
MSVNEKILKAIEIAKPNLLKFLTPKMNWENWQGFLKAFRVRLRLFWRTQADTVIRLPVISMTRIYLSVPSTRF